MKIDKRKKIWKVQLDLLKSLLDVCEKNSIKCYVIWGTLLGAVRHKGFIPWDDDLDVAMDRENFDKLCSIADKHFNHPYFFQTALTDKEFFFSYARLRNSDTTGIINGFSSPNYNSGIFIDIYPLDCQANGKGKQFIQRKMIDISAALARAKTGNRDRNFKTFLLTLIALPFSYEKLCCIHKMWCSNFNYSGSKVGLLYNRNLFKSYQFDTELLQGVTHLTFEDLIVPVPSHFDEILRQVYGDYMVPPPDEQRGCWHEGQIIYDPDKPYKDYYSQTSDTIKH